MTPKTPGNRPAPPCSGRHARSVSHFPAQAAEGPCPTPPQKRGAGASGPREWEGSLLQLYLGLLRRGRGCAVRRFEPILPSLQLGDGHRGVGLEALSSLPAGRLKGEGR